MSEAEVDIKLESLANQMVMAAIAEQSNEEALEVAEKWKCPNKCDQMFMNRIELLRHIDPIEGDCPLALVQCPYSYCGCLIQPMRRNELLLHMELCSILHPQLQANFMKRKLADLENSLLNLQSSDSERIRLTWHLNARLQSLENATYDGMLLWKLENYSQHRHEAIMGTQRCLYSDPFFTSHQGYKLCACVYLNGEGVGEFTHMSLYLVIMKGPCDALLPWPFFQKYTLLLINQESEFRNISQIFPPETNVSRAFMRPVNEMNVPTGSPMFCQLKYMTGNNEFIKNNTIYLGVIVDTTNIPKVLH